MVTINDPTSLLIVRRHFDLNLIANQDAYEVAAHASRDLSQDYLASGTGNAEHGVWQSFQNGTIQISVTHS